MPANCINPDCSKEPNYNYNNKTLPLYGYDHEKDDMIGFDELRLNSKCSFCNGLSHKCFNMLGQFW